MRRLGFTCAVLTLLALAACSGDPAPIEPSAASSSSPAAARPTSTLTPPQLPKQAERKDATGAAAFAGYWIHVLNFAVGSADPDPIQAISMPTCEGCESYVQQIESDRENGIRSEGFKWTPTSVSFEDSNRLDVKLSAAKYRRSQKHHVVKLVPEDKYTIGFELTWANNEWIVRELYLP